MLKFKFRITVSIATIIFLSLSSSLFAQTEEIPAFIKSDVVYNASFYNGDWLFDIPDEGKVKVEFYVEDKKLFRKKENEPEYPRQLENLHSDGVMNLIAVSKMHKELSQEKTTREYFGGVVRDPVYGNIFYYFSDYRDGKFHKCRIKHPDYEYEGWRVTANK